MFGANVALEGDRFITAPFNLANAVAGKWADVMRQSDGQLIADVTLQRVGSNRYEVTIAAPAHTRTDGQSEVYTVTLFATDKSGRKMKKADGTFEVPAPPAAPPPPNP